MHDPQKHILLIGSRDPLGEAIVRKGLQAGYTFICCDAGGETENTEKVIRTDADIASEADRNMLLQELGRSGYPCIVCYNPRMESPRKKSVGLSDHLPSADMRADMQGIAVLMQSIIPQQRNLHYGRWIFFTSIFAQIGAPGMSIAHLFQNMLRSTMRTLALEEGRNGITSNALMIPWIDAGNINRMIPASEVEKHAAENVLLRPVTMEEIADAALFLAGPQSAAITGAEIPVHGGQDMSWHLLI